MTAEPTTGWLARFDPANFSVVMGTGIVSLASHRLGHAIAAWSLFGLSLLSYGTIWIIVLARLAVYPRIMLAELGTASRGPGFLTVVAATGLIGVQLYEFTPWHRAAAALWFAGMTLWVLLGYGFLTLATIREAKPGLQEGITGGWLLLTVSTQSLAVLGTYIAASLPRPDIVIFVCVALHLLGVMLYIMVIVLVFDRWMFFELPPEMLSPSYWINAGALAITTLAGVRLIASGVEPAASMREFLAASNLLFWATATWWIPLLVLTDIWRHAVRKVPLRYELAWWSMAFPVGMYVACTDAYAASARLEFLSAIPRVLIYVAWAAWAAVMAGLGRAILRFLLIAGRQALGNRR